MVANQRTSLHIGALLMAILFLFADMSGMVLAQEPQQGLSSDDVAPILIDGLPPLVCDEVLCERPTRLIDRGERASAEPPMWWLGYGPDLDWNGMDDRLQRVIAGEPSVSPTAIIGPDGRKTVAIVVDYAWHPGEYEIAALRSVLDDHGWVGEEGNAWFQALDSIDALVVDKVPVSALMDIYHLDAVFVIEMQNVKVRTKLLHTF